MSKTVWFIFYSLWMIELCGKLLYHVRLITRVPRNWPQSVSIFGMNVFWVTFSLKLSVLWLQNFRSSFKCNIFSLIWARKSTIKSTFVATCGLFCWPFLDRFFSSDSGFLGRSSARDLHFSRHQKGVYCAPTRLSRHVEDSMIHIL